MEYYIDSVAGSDLNEGTLESPWASFNKLPELKPADIVNVKRGSEFRGCLKVKDSGSPRAPITFQAYGDPRAPKPIINAGRVVGPWTLIGVNLWRATLGPSLVVGSIPALQRNYLMLDPFVDFTTQNIAGVRYADLTSATDPNADFFEVNYDDAAVIVYGDWVHIRNIDAALGKCFVNTGTVISYGEYTQFYGMRVYGSAAFGIAPLNRNCLVERCVTEHNRSTGIHITTGQAIRCVVRRCIARFNGNNYTGVSDAGGIGCQGDYALIEDNFVSDNGDIATGNGDAGIAFSACGQCIVRRNVIIRSVYSGIFHGSEPEGYGFEITDNYIQSWQLGRTTNNPAGIFLTCFGNDPLQGQHYVARNTLVADDAAHVGLIVAQPLSSDIMNNSRFEDNTMNCKLRTFREAQFNNVCFSNNPATEYVTFSGTFVNEADFLAVANTSCGSP